MILHALFPSLNLVVFWLEPNLVQKSESLCLKVFHQTVPHLGKI